MVPRGPGDLSSDLRPRSAQGRGGGRGVARSYCNTRRLDTETAPAYLEHRDSSEDAMNQREIERVFELLKLPVAPEPIARATDRRQVVFLSAESTSKANDTEGHAKLERDTQRDPSHR